MSCQIIAIYGETGSGKTWVANHLSRSLRNPLGKAHGEPLVLLYDEATHICKGTMIDSIKLNRKKAQPNYIIVTTHQQDLLKKNGIRADVIIRCERRAK